MSQPSCCGGMSADMIVSLACAAATALTAKPLVGHRAAGMPHLPSTKAAATLFLHGTLCGPLSALRDSRSCEKLAHTVLLSLVLPAESSEEVERRRVVE